MMKILPHPYTQLSVSGRAVCKETCYQKGIDNVLLRRINEHSASTNPLLQGHTWNTQLLLSLVYNKVHSLFAPVSHALLTLQ